MVPKKSVPACAGRRRGSVMVETCLCFLVFFAMMLGVFDFGQFLFIHQALVERARWALRYGVANYTASTDPASASSGDATCASEGLTTCIENEMLYYSSTAGTTGYFGLSNADANNKMVVVTSVPQYDTNNSCATTPAGTSSNPMPACTPYYYNEAIQITGYKYQVLSLYIAGTFTGPNIYETFPMGQY